MRSSVLLEISSHVLAEALRLERAQRTPGEPLQLEVPSECQPGLTAFVEAAYDQDTLKPRYVGEVKAISETARLLQAAKVLRLCDEQLAAIKCTGSCSDVLQCSSVAAEYSWAFKTGLPQYQARCARFMAENLHTVRSCGFHGTSGDAYLQPFLEQLYNTFVK